MPGITEFTSEFFTESSKAWMANKMKKGHSMVYKCSATTLAGTQCTKGSCMKDGTSMQVCKIHGINKASKTSRDGGKPPENHFTGDAK